MSARHRDQNQKGYGKGRSAHEVQGQWNDAQTADGTSNDMELEDWLYYEDPVEKLAEYDMPDYLPENLARELHEVYATHRENRARLAKAVKARGYHVTKGKGKKGAGKSNGKDGGKSAGKAPPKSKGKGGKARGMSLEELKKVTTCGDCFELGHWKGDPQCKVASILGSLQGQFWSSSLCQYIAAGGVTPVLHCSLVRHFVYRSAWRALPMIANDCLPHGLCRCYYKSSSPTLRDTATRWSKMQMPYNHE